MTVQEMINQLTKLVEERPECGEYELFTMDYANDREIYLNPDFIVYDKYQEVQI